MFLCPKALCEGGSGDPWSERAVQVGRNVKSSGLGTPTHRRMSAWWIASEHSLQLAKINFIFQFYFETVVTKLAQRTQMWSLIKETRCTQRAEL